MMTKRKKAERLPDDACPRCGTTTAEAVGTFPVRVNEEDIDVKSSHLRCPKCDEVVFRLDEMRALREGAQAVYRERHHLLSGVEIRAIRERLGLTQGAFAELLRLGGNTVSRWEAGRTVQTAALDLFLRLVRDVPENVAYLRRRAA